MREKELVKALDMLTEGESSSVAESLGMKTEAIAAKKEQRSWTAAAGIQGLGVGAKITDCEWLSDLVLKVYVIDKLPESKLKQSRKVPKKVEIPGLGELETDVEAIGRMKVESNTSRVRPAIPGFSVGHVKITAGTFGCLVHKKGEKQTLYILSNSHVLANEGLAKKGDDELQPGRYDGGALPADLIGQLAEWVPFTFTGAGFPNLVDAAIATVKTKDVTSVIRLIGVPKGINSAVKREMQVQKTGRTTDYTIGIVKDINYRTALSYNKPGGGKGRVGFKDQVLCTRYTAGGDSGSAVCNMKGEVVGLHFAGSPSSSVFNKIDNVLTALNVEVVNWKV